MNSNKRKRDDAAAETPDRNDGVEQAIVQTDARRFKMDTHSSILNVVTSLRADESGSDLASGSIRIPLQISVNPARLGVKETLEMIKLDLLTVEHYANSILAQIDEQTREGPRVWAYLDPGDVLQQARKLDAIPKDRRGRLHGVSVGVQDVIHVAGMPTRFGSDAYTKDGATKSDATSVALLRREGALIIGKLNTTEFGFHRTPIFGSNPHDRTRVSGTSAWASAVAVASMQVSIALNRDSEGELAMAASYVGVVTLKPTWGTISLDGVKPFSPSFDTIGFLSRSFQDSHLVADTLLGLNKHRVEEPHDTDPERARFELPGSRFLVVLYSETGNNPQQLWAVKKLLQDAGATVHTRQNCGLRAIMPGIRTSATVILKSEAGVSLSHELDSDFHKSGGDEKALERWIQSGQKYSPIEIQGAQNTMAEKRRDLDKLTEEYEAILLIGACDEAQCPVTTRHPCLIWLLGLHAPQMTLPGFQGCNGLPTGVSIISGRHRDKHLLEVCQIVGRLLMEKGGWKSQL